MTDLFDRCGIVRSGRRLVWGLGHGLMVRPHWLAVWIVDTWNAVSCRIGGHEWMPDLDDENLSLLVCPYCCATSEEVAP